MLSKSLLAFSTAMVLATPVWSATLNIGGVTVDDTLAIYNNTLVLNGAGLVMNGKNPLYTAHIYAKKKFTTLEGLFALSGPKRLVITAVREVDTGPILKMLSRSVDSTAAKGDLAKLIPGMVNIGNIFKANHVLKPGDIMMVDWVPITGMVIYIGSKMQGNPMREPELFRATMGVWMGEPPADAGLKKALLGQMQ